MRSKTPPETIALIRRLARDGLPTAEIARQTGISYILTWTYVEGFASQTEYQKHLAEQHQSRPANQELSDLIKNGLELLGENQSWLAQELGVSRQMVSRYIHGKSLPRQELLEKLQAVLGIDYRSIDGLVEEE